MADAINNTVSNTNVSDLPEYVKPYYNLLLKAVTGITFNPNFTQKTLDLSQVPASQQNAAAGLGSFLPYQPQGGYAPQMPVAQAPVATVGAIRQTGRGSGAGQMRGYKKGGRAKAKKYADGGIAQMRTSAIGQSPVGGSVFLNDVGGYVQPGQSVDYPIEVGQPGQVVMIGPGGPAQPGTPGSTPGTGPVIPGGYYDPNAGLYSATPQVGVGLTPSGGGVPNFNPGAGNGTLPGMNPGNGNQGGPIPSQTGGPALDPNQFKPQTRKSVDGYYYDLPTGQLIDYSKFGGTPTADNKYVKIPGYNEKEYATKDTADKMAQTFGGQVAVKPQGWAGPPPDYNIQTSPGATPRNTGIMQQWIDAFGEEQAKKMFDNESKMLAEGHAGGGLMSATKKCYADGGGFGTTSTTPTQMGFSSAATNYYGNPSQQNQGPFQDYTPYGGQRILSSDPNADPTKTWTISDRTKSAESGLSGLPSFFGSDGTLHANPAMGFAADTVGSAGARAGDVYGDLSRLANTFDLQNTPMKSQYTPQSFSVDQVNPNQMGLGSSGTIQMNPWNMFQAQGPDVWNQGIAGAYMNPYQRSVTDVQKQQAVRDFRDAQQYRDANAVRAGAFGGSRQAVVDSLANRDLQNQLAQIEATGTNNAYTNAQQQFNTDRGSQQQNTLANLQAALQTQSGSSAAQLAAAQANQQARLSEFGTLFGGNLQAALANQQAKLQAQNLADQSSRFADTQNLAAQQQSAQLQQQAINQQLAALGQQNLIGGNYADMIRLANQLQTGNLQQQLYSGQAEDARRQAQLDLGYQDFINQKNYPFQLANFYSGILRGVPTAVNQEATQTQKYQYNPWAQGIGAGLGALGTYMQNRNNG